MKKNKSFSLKYLLNKVGEYSSTKFLSELRPRISFKSKKFISQFVKKERFEKINLFNIKNIYRKRSNKSNKNIKNNKTFKSKKFISQFVKKERYKKILEKIKKFKLDSTYFQKENKVENLSQKLILRDYFLKVINDLKNSNFFEKNFKLPENKSIKKYDQKIALAFYIDHNLVIANVIIDLNNNIKINALNEIPIPGNVIGDSLVEDSNELANILLDSLTLLDLINSPLLLILSSSFFNIHTFHTSELKQISELDSQVQSKSPYLPANTFVDFLRMSDSKITNGLVRAIYSKRDFIQSWTDTLEIVNVPIIGIVPASAHVFDAITSKITEENIVLLDIESTQSTLLIGSNLSKLNSYKLPFGYSLYITDNLSESSKNFFERALNSVKLIMKDTSQELPLNIFVMGQGLDQLLNSKVSLPKNFQSISDLNLVNYSYIPKKMQIHEIVSKSIDNTIYSAASILSSCV